MRIRSSDYYLEAVGALPVVLYPDQSVGVLAEQSVEVTEMRPTRVEGRSRSYSYATKRLTQVALYDSLSEYVVGRREHDQPSRYQPWTDSWTLEDIPRDVVAEFEVWRDDYSGPTIDQLVEAAISLQASGAELEADKYDCRHCGGRDDYACYICGRARQLFKYPLVRLATESGCHDVPFDVASVIANNPKSLEIRTAYRINSQQKLEAQRSLAVNMDMADLSYIPELGGGTAWLHGSDRLPASVELVLETWLEDKGANQATGSLGARRLLHGRQPQTPEEYIESLQYYVAQDIAQERLEDAQVYEDEYQDLLQAAGRYGLFLTFQYKYMGMGETDARFSLSSLNSNYQPLRVLSHSIDARHAISDARRSLSGV